MNEKKNITINAGTETNPEYIFTKPQLNKIEFSREILDKDMWFQGHIANLIASGKTISQMNEREIGMIDYLLRRCIRAVPEAKKNRPHNKIEYLLYILALYVENNGNKTHTAEAIKRDRKTVTAALDKLITLDIGGIRFPEAKDTPILTVQEIIDKASKNNLPESITRNLKKFAKQYQLTGNNC